jgi:hypothetical protein
VECAATCPYCNEETTVWVDASGGERQDYVEDCPVCCRPWRVLVWADEEGASVELRRLDD